MSEVRPVEEQIRLELRGAVAWITIDRPEVGNALNPPARDRIRDLIDELNVSKRARCIVLTASGHKLFCPGADLSHVYEKNRPDDVPPQVVGDLARRSGAKALAITHIVPPAADTALVAEEIRASGYAGPLIIGEDLMRLEWPKRLLRWNGATIGL